MRLTFNIIFLFFTAVQCFSQNSYTREITWKTTSIDGKNSGDQFLWFENAVYPDPETMAPSYFELIQLDEVLDYSSNANVEISDDQWIPLNEDEIKLIRNPKEIQNKKFNYSIAMQRKKAFIQLTVPTIRINSNNAIEKLMSFHFKINKTNTNELIKKETLQKSVTTSVLNTGKWVKVDVSESGIYKITYSELQSYGLSNLSNISVWGNGGKKLPYMNSESSPDDLLSIPIYIEKGTDGIFNQGDYILFYAEGPNTLSYNSSYNMWGLEENPYTKKIAYFLTTDKSQNNITTLNAPSGNAAYFTDSYDAIVTFEENDTNLVKSGREWFGETFDITTSRTYNTNLKDPVVGSSLNVLLRAAAQSTSTSSYTLKVNTATIGTLNLGSVVIGDELADLASVGMAKYTSSLPDGELSLSLTYSKPNTSAIGWLDYITVNAREKINYRESQLMFQDFGSVGTGNISQFTISNATQNTRVWDITNINHSYIISSQLSGSKLTFKQSTDSIRNFIAFEPSNAKSVEYVGEIANQNLHGLNQPEMVIVAHPNFLSQAEELADLHRLQDGLNVAVLSTEQVYNEFSSGNPDVSAIRNLMRMLYQRATNDSELPKDLLLFGDGSFDNISDKKGNTNFILTYQSERSINKVQSFVTDDYFGLLDEDEGEAIGLLDIGVGRIPVSTTEQADNVLAKIKKYTSTDNLEDWQSELCFIGDDEDNNIHMQDANTLADYVRDNYIGYNIQKILFDAYLQESSSAGESYPDVTKAINTRVNNGALLVNYTGHGNERWLAHEKVLMLDDVLSWQNFSALPLFVTATCEFSRFDDYNLTSTGEWILLTPKGGGIALLSTTRLVYSDPNFTLNYNFIKTIFEKDSNNAYYRLGDLVRITKNLSGSGYNKRNFTLLGDPALKLRYPEYSMELTTLNGSPINSETDTLKALSNINLTGKVTDSNGNTLESYNGTATITVFDKAKNITTLANNGGNTMTFSSRENVIYKGKASIENGEFSIDFMVPKDIDYQFGTGRISLFASNLSQTAIGGNESITVGGISDTAPEDNAGPEISIYLNDTIFNNGGICDPNPKLVVKLYDESGINTTGIGIGHDLTATLSASDEDDLTFNLNNYYQSSVNSFKEGWVEYQFSDLSTGVKNLKIKAWDIYNNSSEAEISFRVTSGDNLKLTKFYGYPNPFTNETNLYFEHNQPDIDLDITLQIFNMSGMLVKTIHQVESNSGNYRIGPINWNGCNDYGSRVGRGIYICKLTVKSSSGTAQLQQKLIVLK